VKRLAVLALVLTLAACGAQASHDATLIRATNAALDGSAALLAAWDQEHQRGIADAVKAKHGNYSDYAQLAAEYRASRNEVTDALQEAYAAVKTAASKPDVATIAAMGAAVARFYQAARALGANVGGVH
jgi:hypothetical protein